MKNKKKYTNFAINMWIDPYKTTELIVKGLLVGIIASAPMGPVGILTVRRTLNKGRWYGLATGLGASISDLLYAGITLVGMNAVIDFINQPAITLYLKIIGSIMLCLFGIYTYRAKFVLAPPSKNKGSLLHNVLTGFFVTLSNPLIIFLFLALFARFEFVQSTHLIEQIIGGLAIFMGAMCWWLGLTHVIDNVRNRFRMETIGRINRIIGIIVMVVSVIGLIATLLIQG